MNRLAVVAVAEELGDGFPGDFDLTAPQRH